MDKEEREKWDEEYFRRLKGNKIVWEKKDAEDTWLTFWKKPLICEMDGCGKETYLSSHGPAGCHHPFCEEHYAELHAYHVAVLPTILKRLREGDV